MSKMILIDEGTVKLALEALMRSRKAVSGDLDLAGCAYGKNDPDGHRYDDAKQALVTLDKAITALRKALAEQPAPMIRGDIRDGLVDDEPAQSSKPWVGLTPDDIRGLCANTIPSTWDISLCRLVEKFLKEKNT